MQVSAATGLPFSFTAASADMVAPWPEVSVPPVTSRGYGTDPDLVHPAPAPWSRTLTSLQRATLKLLADIIIPQQGTIPSASAVGAVDVMDEWVSAPYPTQQTHRHVILAGLVWLETHSQAQHRRQTNKQRAIQPGEHFSSLSTLQRLAIVDAIAYPERATKPELAMPVKFFALVRQLVVGAFYTSPEGTANLGYIGNKPISGDYPGPTPEAKKHLAQQLKKLGLTPTNH